MKAYRETTLTEDQRTKLKQYIDRIDAYVINPEFKTKTEIEGHLWWKKEVTLYKPKNIPDGVFCVEEYWKYYKGSFRFSPTKEAYALFNLYCMFDHENVSILIDNELYHSLLNVLNEEIK